MQKKYAAETAYESTPEQKHKRALRNKARRDAIRKYGKEALKGKEIDHKVPLENGGSNAKSNLRVVPQAQNRSWRKGSKGYKVNSV